MEAPVAEEQSVEEELRQRPETPSTNHAPSEEISTNPTTPSSQQRTLSIAGDTTPVATKPLHKSAVPAVPIIPALPKSTPREPTKITPEINKAQSAASSQEKKEPLLENEASDNTVPQETVAEESKPVAPAAPAWSTRKVWSGVFNAGAASSAVPAAEAHQGSIAPDATHSTSNSLADILKSFSATAKDSKIAFIEPRGLVNSGNMCYMNSVLQVLIFCVPFYTFLDKVKKGAVHRFNSETPILDAM
jgi:ubiquitin carboxyl-terminal hydrolase 10